ncbi:MULTISPECIES: D-amino acid dehydrogenase [Providencia]|uniref:D-amino acid dehydrogenase n=1 Tax=Providencia TaxID=586 RepID=UPI001B399D36|nr:MULTISPECIES: D-amino acid dehydrogenase [Providencia]EJD6082963.1 D-amino acid dehydrogenase [Providencia rettgeri]EJD6601367.1 D-amino acid dehydrogenase [Providencia rettgeri]ELR5259059.1 D-amino acid dehydrogenase [Providencia rettgeri]MBQ0329831.1 D-amino acid dehydrogenase [Providencia rettgeri]WOC03335.1 D-amino acid dehydrogenase [Providencia sp. PROV024]
MAKHVVIIGAGVIGLSTAYALIKAGQTVTLIESETDVGMHTSFANGGQLSYRYVSPLADAGVPLQGLRWMGKNDSPLNLKITPSVHQWSWLAQFTLACNRKTNRINGDHLLRLSLLSQNMMNLWRQKGDLGDFAWEKSGKLIIHRDSKSFLKASETADKQFQKTLTPAEIIELEPSLKHIQSQLVGAIYAPDDESADCYLFCKNLLQYLQTQPQFNLCLQQSVQYFIKQDNRITGVATHQGIIQADDFIVCAGNGSRELLKSLKINVPILGLKGYSLSVKYPQTENTVPKINVTDYGNKIVYAKLNDQLRIAAMVDIGYDTAGLRENRIKALKKIIKKTFPELPQVDSAESWFGLRPSTPKGPPILGKTAYHNLWLNIGHGSLGFTLAAGSAEILTKLITEQKPPISLTGFTR